MAATSWHIGPRSSISTRSTSTWRIASVSGRALANTFFVLGQCLAWYYLVRSYRQLNTAKYEVVGALEERLPASPYWRAEWYALGEGKDRSRYWPLSHIEQWIPVMFGFAYVAGFIAVVAS